MLSEITNKTRGQYSPFDPAIATMLKSEYDRIDTVVFNNALHNFGVRLELNPTVITSYWGLYYGSTRRIVVYNVISTPEKVGVLVHEMVHAYLHSIGRGRECHSKMFWYTLGIAQQKAGIAILGHEALSVDIDETLNAK